MADVESNFAIVIISMTIVCTILIGLPIAFMLAKSFRMRRKEWSNRDLNLSKFLEFVI